MKKVLILLIVFFVSNLSRSQDRGFTLAYSTNNVAAIDIFGVSGNNRIHIGYAHQFNGQKNEVIKKPKESYGTNEIGDGTYFWVVDIGYSRIFLNKLTAHTEISIGSEHKYTSFEDDRFSDNGYSLVTDKKATIGVGLNLGYYVFKNIEPFIGIHSLKKVNFGARFSW